MNFRGYYYLTSENFYCLTTPGRKQVLQDDQSAPKINHRRIRANNTTVFTLIYSFPTLITQQALRVEDSDDDEDDWLAITTGRGRSKPSRFLSMVEDLLDDLRAEESEMEAQRQDALDEALEVR